MSDWNPGCGAQALSCRSTPSGRPDPWLRNKFMVFYVFGLSIWTFYIVVGRVCAPAIQRRPDAGFSREAGIGILVPYVVLWLMFMWSYFMIISTPPGFARDAVSIGVPEPGKEAQWSQNTRMTPPLDAEENAMANGDIPMAPMTCRDEVPQPAAPDAVHLRESAAPGLAPAPRMPLPPRARIPRPKPFVPTGPRWCQYCKLIKPDRTHHCRHCGTCVLQFDHHCLWIGQCVGWRNHAVFVVFNFWGGLFALYNAGILIASLVSTSKIDPQKIVMAPISGFLGIFTLFVMLPTHVILILIGKSTMEGFQNRTQAATEQAVLQNEFGSMCWVNKDMRQTSKLWQQEYGGVEPTDRWKWGRKRDHWRQEMGSNWVGWILPIGRPEGDGVHYPSNPRFGPNGEWLPVRDWPKVLAVSDRQRAHIV